MPYQVGDGAVAAVVAGWPNDARARFNEVCTVLSLTPWNSQPAQRTNPDGQFRFLPFTTTNGFGFVYFIVIEHAREVSIVDAIWHD